METIASKRVKQPLKKVFTVHTRGHKRKDFGKINGFKVVRTAVGGFSVCLGIKVDRARQIYELGVFEVDGNQIATITTERGGVDVSLKIFGEAEEVDATFHALSALVQEINKEL